MKSVKRGDIYYIERNKSVGHEMRAGRPAVIVSNDALNCKLNTVEVVYLTTSPREHNDKAHVIIKSAAKPSTAICENIATIDTDLLGNWQGMVTKSADIAELEDLIDNRKAENENRYQAACKERDKYKQLAENYRAMLIEELSNKEV